MTTISPDGMALIKHYEGCRLMAYRDAVGIWTIGYGDTQNVQPGLTITQAEADQRLLSRLAAEFVPEVLAAAGAPSQCQLDAMVSLAYNIGTGAFARSTLVRLFRGGDTAGAAAQFTRWDKAGGVSLRGLRRRRVAERALFDGKPLAVALQIGDSTP
ncbi:lysozyme [Castellaniella ginsengisoli]|uniref:Lysozyme n=1 Tax=Castellaniella ginsengisoli TaxID=546114 RepID=A0AB39FYR9_9BURK